VEGVADVAEDDGLVDPEDDREMIWEVECVKR
jgi:hypothetical protein